jgi:hypothetical protein
LYILKNLLPLLRLIYKVTIYDQFMDSCAFLNVVLSLPFISGSDLRKRINSQPPVLRFPVVNSEHITVLAFSSDLDFPVCHLDQLLQPTSS